MKGSLKLNRKKSSGKVYVYSFRFAFPSYTLLIPILLFTSEIWPRIYLRLEEISFLKHWRAQQRRTVSVELHSCCCVP